MSFIQFDQQSAPLINEDIIIGRRGGGAPERSAKGTPTDNIMLKAVLNLVSLAVVAGHASMIAPPTRNAVDSDLPAWSNGKRVLQVHEHDTHQDDPRRLIAANHESRADPNTGWIEPYNCACTNGTEASCNNGQSCFWFSQGCTGFCEKCDGQGQRYPSWDHCPGTPKPQSFIDGTYLDKKWWTANQNVTAGSHEDVTLPALDPCATPGARGQHRDARIESCRCHRYGDLTPGVRLDMRRSSTPVAWRAVCSKRSSTQAPTIRPLMQSKATSAHRF